MDSVTAQLLRGEGGRMTPEFAGAMSFVKRATAECSDPAWESRVPQAAAGVEHVRNVDPSVVEACLASQASWKLPESIALVPHLRINNQSANLRVAKPPPAAAGPCRAQAGSGRPLLVADAFRDWGPGAEAWGLAALRRRFSDHTVMVNDRAPARRADALLPSAGGAQRTLRLPLAQYLNYLEILPAGVEQLASSHRALTPPYYLNGWRAFAELPALAAELPEAPPYFAALADNTVELLRAVDQSLFGAGKGGGGGTGASNWCCSVDRSLTKLFISPAGATTRLHFDAGSAHGWLGQVQGRKLFVLLPPGAAGYLHQLEGEPETQQSPVDPLTPDLGAHPAYAQARPLACVVGPGEALLVPQGWWHYALTLERSVTLQRNFYHAASNAQGLVAMVLKSLAGARVRQAQGASGGARAPQAA